MSTELRTPRTAWRIVALREIMTKLKSKAFIVSTLLTLAVLIAVMAFSMFGSGRATTYRVATTDPDAVAVVKIANDMPSASPGESGDVWESVSFDSPDAARQAVKDGDADVYLSHGDSGWVAVVKTIDMNSNSMGTTLQPAVAAYVTQQNAMKLGISATDLSAGSNVDLQATDGKEAQQQLIAFVIGMIFAVLFYVAAILFGLQIAQSVVQEKESRIAEILTAAIPVRQLLAGKVIGNSALALGQIVLYLAVGLIGISFTQYASFLPLMARGTGWFIAFFVTGFLALSCLWAAAGAMATRNEDLSSTTSPMMMILMAGYFAAFFASGTLQTVLSFVPVISSVVMPIRLLAGTAEWWEGAIALALNIAFLVVGVRVGEIIYRRGLLQTQGMLKLRQAFRTAD